MWLYGGQRICNPILFNPPKAVEICNHFMTVLMAKLNGASDRPKYLLESLHLESPSDGKHIDTGADYIQV